MIVRRVNSISRAKSWSEVTAAMARLSAFLRRAIPGQRRACVRLPFDGDGKFLLPAAADLNFAHGLTVSSGGKYVLAGSSGA